MSILPHFTEVKYGTKNANKNTGGITARILDPFHTNWVYMV